MNNNYECMQEFLNVLKEFAISNPNKEITRDFVYSILVRFRVEKNEESFMPAVKQDYYEGWKERFKNVNNLNVDDHVQGDFCWFLNTYDVINAIKLYIPLDYDHIKEGAEQLFDFISSTNMIHQSKIASKIRNDNVVVRVNSLEDAQKIVNFVSSNSYIQEGMLKVNPFLPNMNGIGMVMDNDYSFNGELSSLLSSFIEWLKKENRLDLVTVEEFNKYIKFQIEYVNDLDLKNIYSLLEKTTSKSFHIQEFVEQAKSKLVNDYDQQRKRITDPSYYLEKAIIVTENHYPGNSKEAILNYLNNNADFFTRKENARAGLVKYVKPGDVISLITKKLHESGITYAVNQEELIEKYLDLVLNRQKEQNDIVEKPNNPDSVDQQNPYIAEFEIIKKAFINTERKYNETIPEQAESAFIKLYLYNNPESFTNSFGDRTKLKELVKTCDIKKVILSNIDIAGLDINSIEEITSRFKSVIYQDINNKKL